MEELSKEGWGGFKEILKSFRERSVFITLFMRVKHGLKSLKGRNKLNGFWSNHPMENMQSLKGKFQKVNNMNIFIV